MDDNITNNKNQDYNKELFFKVFNNCVLRSIIQSYLTLYKKNQTVDIFELKELLNYKEREFIHHLIYHCNYKLKPNYIPNVKILTFGNLFNKPLTQGCIPNSVKVLKFGINYYKPIKPNVLPSSIESLTLGDTFNLKLSVDSIPFGVKRLDMGFNYNITLDKGIIPSSVTSLKLGAKYNRYLRDNAIPDSVTSIQTGLNFNQIIDRPTALPAKLVKLKFGFGFNSPILPGCLPNTLQILRFGSNFNQYITDLPNSITILECGNNFNNSSLNNILPSLSNLKELRLGLYFAQAFSSGILPLSLTTLSIGSNCSEKLNIFGIGVLPASLTSLSLEGNFNSFIKPGSIPSSVISLRLGNHFNQVLAKDSIPPFTQHLILGKSYNQPFLEDQSLPPSLLVLSLCNHAYSNENIQSLSCSLPNSLKVFNVTQNIFTNIFVSKIKLPPSVNLIVKYWSYNS